MALPFSDLPTLLDQAHRSDTESEQSSHPEQSGVNPLLDNITDITSLVQSADLARKLTADPLVTDLWRLYTKGQHHIPQAKRFENLMWRRMAIKLVCPKAGSASSESNLSTPTDYSVPERESITIPVDGAPVAKFQISPIRDTKNTSTHYTPLKPAPQNYSKPEPTSRPQIALKNESSGGTVGHTEGNNAQYSASEVSYPYDITTMINDINNGVGQNNAGLAHLAPNPAPQIYMPAQNYYNPNYAPNQYTSFGRGGGSGDGGGGDDVGGFENLNNEFSTNSQAWYDPTYANFSSMLNRNWVNLNGIPAPNGDVSPFNHSTFVDYVAVNQPPVRRSRTALELGLLNQADSNTLSYLTDSLQSAQASRIRELEQQITLLLADRPPNRFTYHPSASTAAPLVVPNPTNYPSGTLGTYAQVNNLFATDSISMAPVQNYQVKVDNQPRSIIPGPEPASNLRPEYSRSSSLGNYFSTQQQAPDSYHPAVSTSKANSAKSSQLQAKPSEPQSAFSVNALAEYRTSPPANQSAQIKQGSNEYSESHRPARPPRPSSDSGKESGGEAPRMVCDNCGVSKTSLWRRSSSGAPLCNACGLFSKLHGKERPLSMKTEVIRKRNRGPAGGRNNGARKRAKTPDP